MLNSSDLLFNKQKMNAMREAAINSIRKRIEILEEDLFVENTMEELVQHFVEEFSFEIPKIFPNKITIKEPIEKHIESNELWDRYTEVIGKVRTDPFNENRNFRVMAYEISVFIPFEGEQSLLQVQPSHHFDEVIRADTKENEIIFEYLFLNTLNSEALKNKIDKAIKHIQKTLEWMEQDVPGYRSHILQHARILLEKRKKEVDELSAFKQNLPFPLKERPNEKRSFKLSKKRTSLDTLKKPAPNSNNGRLPTVLDSKGYEQILSTLVSMSTTIERNPEAFSKMKEEDLRWLFLVYLNDAFTGAVSGETFNFSGKTDILIRIEDENIFIAECKYWDGPKSLKKALDQILGYLTVWDSQTAILLFVRNKNFTDVYNQIPDVIGEHPNFISRRNCDSKRGYRFLVRHKYDEKQSINLTVLAFAVPDVLSDKQ